MTVFRAQDKKQKKKGQYPEIEALLAEGKIQEVVDRLNVRQRRFAEEYLVDFNASAAVRRAGYQTKYPERVGYQLVRHPGVKAMIDAMTAERASKSVVKPDYVVNKIIKTIERAEENGQHNAVLRGCELLARHLGMFIERTEISGPNGEAIKYEQVQEAADAFTSAIASIIDRRGEDETSLYVEPRS